MNKMDKSMLGYMIGQKEPYNTYAIYWNHYTKKELQEEYNKLYNK